MEVLDLSGGVKVEPLVSIITPSYNSEKYLDAFFISILEQDYEKYEIIFINDGSTDRTENIVYKYKEKFEERNIRFVYLKQENGGQAKAMNLGFPYIQGKYFIWPDSDDELYRNNISEKVKYMEQIFKHAEHPQQSSLFIYNFSILFSFHISQSYKYRSKIVSCKYNMKNTNKN